MNIIKKLKIFQPKIEDFEILHTLGQGAFGEVFLVKKNNNINQIYALKVIDKKFLYTQGKAHHVFLEKLYLNNLKHAQIVKLYDTFQDEKRLYFLMEVIENGELNEYVKINGCLKRKNEFKRNKVFNCSNN